MFICHRCAITRNYDGFHLSCLTVSTPLPKGWYCPYCCRLPQFKRLRKVKKTSSEIMGQALSLDSVCIRQAVPQQSDKLLECHSKDCQSGKFFHLTCLGYKKMPNNSKTTRPQFKRLRKVKKNSSEIMGQALSLDSVCIRQAVPQ